MLRGEIWFRSLSHYKILENDTRGDVLEGAAYINDATGITLQIAPLGTNDFGPPIQMTGQLRKSLTHAERFFISSYSYRRHKDQQKFGRFIVRIHQARPWLNAIARQLPSLFWGRASYFDPANPAHIASANSLWLSKQTTHRKEHEFRLLMLIDGHEPGHAERALARIVMGDLSSAAEIIEESC